MELNKAPKWIRRAATSIFGSLLVGTVAFAGAPEKTDLKFGFIKLTDMAPLAIALEKGFFADEGLNVTLEAMPNWGAIKRVSQTGRSTVPICCPVSHWRLKLAWAKSTSRSSRRFRWI